MKVYKMLTTPHGCIATLVAAAPLLAGSAAAQGGCEPQWIPTSAGQIGRVEALTVFDDGSGPALYVGGFFSSVGGVSGTTKIARWDGKEWSALGSGMNDFFLHAVVALTVFDDGSGPALYAGGTFTSAGGVSGTSRIAKWDGTQWSALGSGVDGQVVALTVFDDGTGPALYAGGHFNSASGVPQTGRIAKWDGAAWSSLGANMDGGVLALEVFDDGSGPALYAGGTFTNAGGQEVNHIARWDGESWSDVGGGVIGDGFAGQVNSLAVFDDGMGPALYVGGWFFSAGFVSVTRIARWSGPELGWSEVGGGMNNTVNVLRVVNDGSGPALFAGGFFDDTTGGPAGVNNIGKWDGTEWLAMGTGMNEGGQVVALAGFDDGSGPALFVGGVFSEPIEGDTNFAKWGCPGVIVGDLNGDGSVGVADLLILLAAWGDCADCSDCPADLTGDCTVGVADLLILLANWG